MRRAGKYDAQLTGGGIVKWWGYGGAGSSELLEKIQKLLYKEPYPTTLIIHIGTNDIFKYKTGDIKQVIKANLLSLRKLLPNSKLIWSDIIARLAYHREKVKGAGAKVTRNLNKCARQVCRRKLDNAHVITHYTTIHPDKRNVNGRADL